MKIEKIDIDKIIEYSGNVKEHPEWQIEQIKNSIKEFGFNDPIAIDENGIIIEGHGRLIALKELGYKEVECIRLEHLMEEQKAAYAIVHNKLTMNTDFDIEKLQYELNKLELSGFNLELLGFEKMELDDIMEAETEILELDEEEMETTERQKHKLICPFCRKIGLKSEFKKVLENGEDT